MYTETPPTLHLRLTLIKLYPGSSTLTVGAFFIQDLERQMVSGAKSNDAKKTYSTFHLSF